MGLMSIDVCCTECLARWDILVERPAPDFGEPIPGEVCIACNMPGYRAISMPMNLRASHPDGYDRGPGYRALKEAARLRSDRANLPNTDAARADITKEIRTVEKASLRGSTKTEKGQK